MSVQIRLTGQDKDLGGGFMVRRLLPAAQRQSVGPFVFFDHFGPLTVQPRSSHDVRPHPHIGLATVTYLFDSAIMHRDSLGSVQRLMVVGGDTLDAHRFIWWNFVSSRKERIVQAGEDWAAQKMGQVAGDAEFIPLPERRLEPAEPVEPATPRPPYL